MKLINLIIFFLILSAMSSISDENFNFKKWKKDFKLIALKNGISEKTFNITMQNVKFLPKVIEYDRFQPEFYEDTKTYITKRTSNKKLKKGIEFFEKNNKGFYIIGNYHLGVSVSDCIKNSKELVETKFK